MKRLIVAALLVLVLLLSQNVFAQDTPAPSQTVSFQPILWLNNMVPRDMVGFSGQYERGIVKNQSAVVRIVWFRDPLFGKGYESWGVGISGEYRFYFSDNIRGWHLGPIVEGIGYQWLGYNKKFHGDEVKNLFDVGVQAGHKWISGHVSFDLSVRTAFFSSENFPSSKLFPQRGSQDFNSHLLISLGYAY